MVKLLGFDERMEYIAGTCIVPEHDIITLDGIGYGGMWYIGHKISTGEIIREIYWPLAGVKFNFGDLGRFSFPHNTIREVRRRDLIEKYEVIHGKDSAWYIEDMIGMPWERIWEVAWKNRPERIILK